MKSKHRVASLAATLAMCLATVGVSAAVAPSAGAAGSNTLTVKAGEYTYKLSGSPKAGWTQINFQNDGMEYHMMAVFPLKKGVTVAQLTKAAESQDQSAFDPIAGKGQVFGAPDLLSPGAKTTVITKLPAGHYGVLCFIPAPDGEVAHRARHGQDLRRQQLQVEPDATHRRPGRGDHRRRRDHAPDVGDARARLGEGHEQRLGAAELRHRALHDGDARRSRRPTPTSTRSSSRARFPRATRRPRSRVVRSRFPPGGTATSQLDLKPGNYVFVSDTDDDKDGSKQIHQEFTVK